MPLQSGPGTIKSNVSELMSKVQSPARKKAIVTLAKKHNISLKEAQFRQAKAIAVSQSRKGN